MAADPQEDGRRGRFITLEGGEGTGKSTQTRLLRDTLQDLGIEAIATREPGGTPSAEAIRRLLVEGEAGRWQPTSEVLLHYAARNEHLHGLVLPALRRGAWVISDRFADSTLAYQGYGLGVAPEMIRSLSRLVLGDFQPDLTLILDLPVEEGLRRAAARSGTETRYERMPRALHERLRKGFLEIAEVQPERCVVVNAEPGVEAVRSAVWATVRDRYGLGG